MKTKKLTLAAFAKKSELRISMGNRKMGAIPSVSLPPILTCRKNAPCARDCYACKLCRIYKNVKESYMKNYELLNCNHVKYFEELSTAMSLSTHFRMHVSGDIPNDYYFYCLVKIIKKNPGCQVLMFTKQYEIVNKYLEYGHKLPKNLKLLFSGWNEWQPENPYKFPKTDVIKTIDELPKNGILCNGNCSNCVCRNTGCWNLKKGQTLYFIKH